MYNFNFCNDLKTCSNPCAKMEIKTYCSNIISHHQSYSLIFVKLLHLKKLFFFQIFEIFPENSSNNHSLPFNTSLKIYSNSCHKTSMNQASSVVTYTIIFHLCPSCQSVKLLLSNMSNKDNTILYPRPLTSLSNKDSMVLPLTLPPLYIGFHLRNLMHRKI
jgi:hypothetical protein